MFTANPTLFPFPEKEEVLVQEHEEEQEEDEDEEALHYSEILGVIPLQRLAKIVRQPPSPYYPQASSALRPQETQPYQILQRIPATQMQS